MCLSHDLVQGVPIATVAAGVGHTVFISRSGHGYWCGEGMDKERKVRAVTFIPGMELLVTAPGSFHCYIGLCHAQPHGSPRAAALCSHWQLSHCPEDEVYRDTDYGPVHNHCLLDHVIGQVV